MKKTYTQPQFTLVRTDGQNKVFFAASSNPKYTSASGAAMTLSSSGNAVEWF